MLPGQALTTAMGILPHTNLLEAQNLALSLDIPFWPQLPHFRFREDMYAQFAEHFPGMIVDEVKRSLSFSTNALHRKLMNILRKALYQSTLLWPKNPRQRLADFWRQTFPLTL